MFVGVLADDEFLRVGVVARIDSHLLHPFRRFHCSFRLELDVGHDWYIAAALAQTFDDVLEVARVFHSGCGDAADLTTGIRQFHRLPDARLRVHRVARDHRLDTDRVVPADTDVAHLHLTRFAAVINEWIFAK